MWWTKEGDFCVFFFFLCVWGDALAVVGSGKKSGDSQERNHSGEVEEE